jgi:hypothetical protein
MAQRDRLLIDKKLQVGKGDKRVYPSRAKKRSLNHVDLSLVRLKKFDRLLRLRDSTDRSSTVTSAVTSTTRKDNS